MNSWFIKNFKKKEHIIVYYTDETKRTHKYYTLQRNGIVTVQGRDYLLNPDTVYTIEGTPHVYLNHITAVPINIFDTPKTNPDPKGLHTAINAQVAQEMWNAQKKSTFDLASMAGIGAFLGVLYLAYMLSTLTTQIEALQTLLGGN